MKKLYKFYWDCGRSGSLEGMFIAEEKDVQDAIGESVHFGEVLGKHSEVYGVIEEGEIAEVKVSETTVTEMEEVIGSIISGFNPLHYIRYTCDECGDSMSLDDCDWYKDEEDNYICGYCINEENKEGLIKI